MFVAIDVNMKANDRPRYNNDLLPISNLFCESFCMCLKKTKQILIVNKIDIKKDMYNALLSIVISVSIIQLYTISNEK